VDHFLKEPKMRIQFVMAALAMAAALPQAALAAGDAAAGAAVFKSKCTICHSVTQGQNRVGPSLFGVVGRKSGQAPNYNYSEANKNSGKTWDEATLDVYLTNPRALVPGTKMAFAGLPDATDRANVIAYLATQK
jgi:cytochrome c